jgi:hypothetical protein
VVTDLGELVQENYGRPGLSHIFVAGANDDGMKEVIISSFSFKSGVCGRAISEIGAMQLVWRKQICPMSLLNSRL